MPRGETKNVGALLLDAERVLLAELYDRLALAGFADLPLAAAPLFRHVDLDGSLLVDVTARGQRPEVVDQVARLGYVVVGDERLRLTERGRAVAAAGQRALREIEQSWRERLGPERFDVFLDVLADL